MFAVRERAVRASRHSMRRSLAALLFAACALCAAPAAAAGTKVDAAEKLFEEARALLAIGHYHEACAKLESSDALDPGMGTKFNLVRCYELDGRAARAWQMYTTVATLAHDAGQAPREEIARERAAAQMPRRCT